MGLFANYTGEKIIISKNPVIINGITYDPKTHKEDIKGFKWFKNQSKAYDYFGLNKKIGHELHLIELSNGATMYIIGIDDSDCRDKAMDYISQRYFGNPTIYIATTKHIAETESKGFTSKLIL
jgi:hypothetical protein